jgi:hypothetical protein
MQELHNSAAGMDGTSCLSARLYKKEAPHHVSELPMPEVTFCEYAMARLPKHTMHAAHQLHQAGVLTVDLPTRDNRYQPTCCFCMRCAARRWRHATMLFAGVHACCRDAGCFIWPSGPSSHGSACAELVNTCDRTACLSFYPAQYHYAPAA